MTYVVREITDARAMGHTAFASFATFAEAQAHIEENFIVRFFERDEDNDAADIIANYAKSPNGIPFTLSIEAV